MKKQKKQRYKFVYSDTEWTKDIPGWKWQLRGTEEDWESYKKYYGDRIALISQTPIEDES